MSRTHPSAYDACEHLKKACPEALDLLTATTDTQFDEAVQAYLDKVVRKLEQNKSAYAALGEDEITGVVVTALSLVPGLQVSRETSSNGHVDITIEATYSKPQRSKLGEAKIYRGYKYHVDGVEQLLGRYATGRECKGFMLVYVKKANVSGLMSGIQSEMDTKLPCEQTGPSRKGSLRWAFTTNHKHSCGDCLDVDHIACNLF